VINQLANPLNFFWGFKALRPWLDEAATALIIPEQFESISNLRFNGKIRRDF